MFWGRRTETARELRIFSRDFRFLDCLVGRTPLALLAMLVFLGTGVTSCGFSAPSKGTIRLPFQGTPEFDPVHGTSLQNLWLDSLLYDGLVKFDASMHIVPDLAVALPSISAGGRVYDFTIRNDAKFCDGRPVLASDVAFSLLRSTHLSRVLRNDVAGVKAIGRRQLQISLAHADSDFLAKLALPQAAVLDAASVKKGGKWWLRGSGSGGFSLQKIGKDVILASNKHYDGGPMTIHKLELIPVGSSAEAYRLYRSGRLDGSPVPVSHFASSVKSPQFLSTYSTRSYYLGLDGISSRRARVAVDESLDRSRLFSSGSGFDPNTTIVPPTVPDYPAASDPHSLDVVSARKGLLVSSPITLSSARGADLKWIDSKLRRSLRKLGIKVDPAGDSRPKKRLSLELKVFDRNILLPEADLWLSSIAQAAAKGSQRRQILKMLRSGRQVNATANPLQQDSIFNKAELYLFGRALVAPLAVQMEGYLVTPKLHGLVATPIGLQPANQEWSSVTVD